jgi:hypothetical protein
MTGISNYTLLNVGDSTAAVTASQDGSTLTVAGQKTTQTIYVLALLNQADTKNSNNMAALMNQIQAASNSSQQASGLITGLSNVDISSGTATNAAIYTALRASLASANLSDAQIATLFQTATGTALGANNTTSTWSDTNFASALSNAKAYAQNLTHSNTVLQNQLENMINLRTNFNEAMAALINNLNNAQQTVSRNIGG